jgi:hypothetical protein
MFEVTYIVKDASGYVKEQKARFAYLQDAIRFVRSINGSTVATSRAIGKPTIERV